MHINLKIQRGARLASLAVVASVVVSTVPAAYAADPQPGQALRATAAPALHKAEGVVRSTGDEVVIKHGPIPTLGMGAMTMAYKAPKGGVPKNVKPGTNVKFEFVMTPQGEMQLTSIVPAGGAGK